MGGISASAVNLLESVSPFIVSDTLQQQDQTATSTLWEFFSDSETPLGSVPGPVLLETGAVQPTLVITYFNASNAVIGTDTLNIQSDAPEGVPEPATVVMGLSGLVLIGAWRRYTSQTRERVCHDSWLDGAKQNSSPLGPGCHRSGIIRREAIH